ncbi:MAG TPA: DUF5777 family beta-barrel protein [Thermoanaerobaculia bacterium]|nr:DUF5777 family beta-barrel protein [Thermoanaerobaculia bacterium]
MTERRLAAACWLACCWAAAASAQESGGSPYEPVPRDGVGAQVINMPTPFPAGARRLEIVFTHRFQQTVQDGSASDLWGLDGAADTGIGLAYGLSRAFEVGLYRSSFQENFELAGKFLLFEQAPRVPLSIALRAGVDRVERAEVEDPTRPFAQLLLARRLARGVNLFLAPSWAGDTPRLRDAFNVPVGLTLPLGRGLLLELEVVPENRDLEGSVAAWHAALSKSVGLHVFEVVLGNSRATTVDLMLGGDFPAGYAEDDVRLGFNLVRDFTF